MISQEVKESDPQRGAQRGAQTEPEADPELQTVAAAWPHLAPPIKAGILAMVAAAAAGAPVLAPGLPQASRKPSPVAEFSKEELALAVLIKHPEWSNEAIAARVGCNPAGMARMKRFTGARAALKAGREEIATGARDADGDVEAFGDDPQ